MNKVPSTLHGVEVEFDKMSHTPVWTGLISRKAKCNKYKEQNTNCYFSQVAPQHWNSESQ